MPQRKASVLKIGSDSDGGLRIDLVTAQPVSSQAPLPGPSAGAGIRRFTLLQEAGGGLDFKQDALSECSECDEANEIEAGASSINISSERSMDRKLAAIKDSQNKHHRGPGREPEAEMVALDVTLSTDDPPGPSEVSIEEEELALQRMLRYTQGDPEIERGRTAAHAYNSSRPDRRRKVSPDQSRKPSRVSIRRETNAGAFVDEVDVPHEIIDVLAFNMPRMLQLFRRWSKGKGEVSFDQFERMLFTLGVRYSLTQLTRLFRVLDADSSGHVSIEELLLLKFAIDNNITAIPTTHLQRGSHLTRSGMETEMMLRLTELDKVDKYARQFGFFTLAKPVLGAVWKGNLRPHHSLGMTHSWQNRGTPPVQARLRLTRDDNGPRVRLRLIPTFDHVPNESPRFCYHAGPVASVKDFCEEMHTRIKAATEHAALEIGALLTEVREMDLKLEEATLVASSARVHAHEAKDPSLLSASREAQDAIDILKATLSAAASDAESCLVAQTRYTRDSFMPTQLIGYPKPAPIREVLAQEVGHRSTRVWTKHLAQISGGMLIFTAVVYVGVWAGVGSDFYHNHDVCEFQEYACQTRPWQYSCNRSSDSERTITLIPASSGMPPYDWGDELLDEVCYESLQLRSFWFILPVPFLFLASVVLPLGLFRNNAHRVTIRKCILWTPVVPLIIVQCILRAIILLSVISTASDKNYAIILGAEAMVLVPQVTVFLLMDAMRNPTPVLRIGFAVALILRFGSSLMSRSLSQVASEQLPLIESGSLRDRFMGLGSASKQTTICSIDWAITVTMFSSIVSVLNYPSEMAVVRLRCDTKGYFNWRDRYLGAMRIRSHHRDLDVADRYMGIRARATTVRSALNKARRDPNSWLPIADGVKYLKSSLHASRESMRNSRSSRRTQSRVTSGLRETPRRLSRDSSSEKIRKSTSGGLRFNSVGRLPGLTPSADGNVAMGTALADVEDGGLSQRPGSEEQAQDAADKPSPRPSARSVSVNI